jgi:hypothetical protein
MLWDLGRKAEADRRKFDHARRLIEQGEFRHYITTSSLRVASPNRSSHGGSSRGSPLHAGRSRIC